MGDARHQGHCAKSCGGCRNAPASAAADLRSHPQAWHAAQAAGADLMQVTGQLGAPCCNMCDTSILAACCNKRTLQRVITTDEKSCAALVNNCLTCAALLPYCLLQKFTRDACYAVQACAVGAGGAPLSNAVLQSQPPQSRSLAEYKDGSFVLGRPFFNVPKVEALDSEEARQLAAQVRQDHLKRPVAPHCGLTAHPSIWLAVLPIPTHVITSPDSLAFKGVV